MMKFPALERLVRGREPILIVAVVLLCTVLLVTFERVTGLPASLRSAPIYQPLPSGSLRGAAPVRGKGMMERRARRQRLLQQQASSQH